MAAQHIVADGRAVVLAPISPWLVLWDRHFVHTVHTSMVGLACCRTHIGLVESVLVLALPKHVECTEYGSLMGQFYHHFAAKYLAHCLVHFAQMDWQLIVHFAANMIGMDDLLRPDSRHVEVEDGFEEQQLNIGFGALFAVDPISNNRFEQFAERFDNEVAGIGRPIADSMTIIVAESAIVIVVVAVVVPMVLLHTDTMV